MKTLLSRVWNALRAVSPWELLRIAADAALQTELGELTREIVAEIELAQTDLPGIEKHALAVARIVNLARGGGINWSTSLVNLLIELAVYLLKRKLGGPQP